MPTATLDLDQVFQTLGDPTRRAVLQRLCQGPCTVSELKEPFKMALPSFMQHLQMMEASGLIRSVKKGRVRTCEVNPQALEGTEAWLNRQRSLWTRRLNQLDHYLLDLKLQEKK